MVDVCPFNFSIMSLQGPYNQVRYSLIGESGVIQFFQIDYETGDISLKKSLLDDPNTRGNYRVCIYLFIFQIYSTVY